jgi:hypothetical protein
MASETIKLLVTVKAYPALSTKYGETVCVAGIQVDPPPLQWIRLFPVPFRTLPFEKRFKKYTVVSVDVTIPTTDRRPESRHADPESFQVIERWESTRDNWARRLSVLSPLMKQSLCEIKRLQARDKSSLGIFKPAGITDFVMEPADSDWEPKKHLTRDQLNLIDNNHSALEKIPWEFRYRFRCEETGCDGHFVSSIDWELGGAYRNFMKRYPPARVPEMLRDKWFIEMCGPQKDTYFFVGNMHLRPRQFLVLGVVWPKRANAS